MFETDQVEFNIEVNRQDTSVEDIDWLTRQSLAELRELDVESAGKKR